jgi:UDPglucose 6-dehydrogenase
MQVTIAGTGYVGLTCAAVFAAMGHEVCAYDVDTAKVERLRQGQVTFFEPGLAELLAEQADHIRFTDDASVAYAHPELVFICVPTPEMPDGSVRLTYLHAACEQIVQELRQDTVVCLKSTVPFGTNEQVDAFFAGELGGRGLKVEVVSNPEFLSQGSAVQNMLHPYRVVVGVESAAARQVMERFYADVEAPVYFYNRAGAELAKYAANNFLALKVSYINEIANLCEQFGANVEDVAQALGADPRIGSKFLQAGIGYGGSCFPKDSAAISWLAANNQLSMKTVDASREVNAEQNFRLVRKLAALYPNLRGRRIAVWGLSFKPDTDDLRESPAIKNIRYLLDAGACVRAFDPQAMPNFRRQYASWLADPHLTLGESPQDTLKGSDACLIFTEWAQFKEFDLAQFKAHMAAPVVLDGRNIYRLEDAAAAGLTYLSIGRAAVGMPDGEQASGAVAGSTPGSPASAGAR